jgi:hypothetical protein
MGTGFEPAAITVKQNASLTLHWIFDLKSFKFRSKE